ncbi:MAG: hypothetical protein Q8N04_01945 [Nitrospira sp.]|nr:hypothetical protein [Nitrospira sp.]
MSLGISIGRRRRLEGALCTATALLTLQLGGVGGSVWAFEPWQPQERWLIESGRVAPWAKPGTTALENAGLAGQAILVEGKAVTAPHPLACEQAQNTFIVMPAEGLFEGGLPAPAGRAARALGLTSMPVLTWRMTCRNGSFDYHLFSKQEAMLGLDHVVWQVRRTSLELSPEAAVLELLRQHMTRDMAFTKGSVAKKASMLTDSLTKAIAAYFARPVPQDEVPVINGDPFTNSQEYPTGFTVGAVLRVGSRATVPVRFDEEGRYKLVEYRLQLSGTTWGVDDLHYPDGATFRGLLKPAKGR